MLLNTRYEEHHYNSRKITQLQRKFPHVPSDINEVAIITGLRSTYSGKKITKNQAEDLSIKYRTNIDDYLKEAGKGPAAMNIRNMQRREEDRTLDRRTKYIEGKLSKSGTNFVTQQQTDGSTQEITDKTSLGEVII